jgi:retron-type reverse transcriptase
MFHATERGTPQGGVVSPLLANIALHGMEQAIGVTYDRRGQLIGKRAVVRYADDARLLLPAPKKTLNTCKASLRNGCA